MKNSQWQRALVWFAFLAVCAAGCHRNHTTPYFHPDIVALAPDPPASKDEPVLRVLLIGDAGEPAFPTEPVLMALESRAKEKPERTYIIFLGDNIYPRGMPLKEDPSAPTTPARREAERRLRAQLDVVRHSGTEAFFVPGNHDWSFDSRGHLTYAFFHSPDLRARLKKINAQAAFVDDNGQGNARVAPRMKCLEDKSVQRESLNGTEVVFLDTEVWLMVNDRLDNDKQDLIDELDAASSADSTSPVIIVTGHHPLQSYGPHGGVVQWNPLVLPLQVLKAMFVLLFNPEDLAHSRNQRMVEALKEAMSDRSVLIYAAGHEHSLQILRGHDSPKFLLISGAGSATKLSPVWHGQDTLFAVSHAGFMELDVFRDHRVFLRVFVADDAGRPRLVFTHWLQNAKPAVELHGSATDADCSSLPRNRSRRNTQSRPVSESSPPATRGMASISTHRDQRDFSRFGDSGTGIRGMLNVYCRRAA